MLDRQFGINPPSLEDDEDDTPLYTSSREALGDITGRKAPAFQAPKGVKGGDPYAYLDSLGGSPTPAAARPAATASPKSADPYAYLDGDIADVAAPTAKKSKNFVDRTAEVVDPAISRIFGDTKPEESQIDKPGLARYKEEQKARNAEIAGLRALVDDGEDPSLRRRVAKLLASGFMSGVGSAVEGTGRALDSKTLQSIGDAMSKAAGAFAPEDPTLSEKVVMGVGSFGSFFLPGAGLAKGAKLLGAARAAPAVGAGGSAVLESAAIMQETYEKALSETGNEDLATQQAWKAAGLNLPLSFITNKVGLFGTKGGRVQRGVVAGLGEGFQEGSQNVLTNVLGFKPAGEGATESAFIGTVTGGGVKMTIDAVNQYFDEASPQERKDIVDKIIEGGRETRQGVFDSLMSNDATAKILREAGISSAEDPAFVKFGAALGRFDREFAELAADPEVGPKLIANGILDPNDPRVQRVADRVLNSKQEIKGINEILEVTRSGVELTTDQKDQFNLLSAATNARELVDEITSNPELENVLKDMPGTAGFEGNRYNQIMGLWQKATLPAKAPTIAVDSKGVADTAAPNVRAGVEGAARQRAEMDKEASDAFRIAEARRQRAQQGRFETGVQPLDTQAGGRPGGVGAKQEFAYFNPVIKDGQMVSGDRVEVVSGDQILDRITLGGLQVSPERAIFLRFLDRPGQPEFPVPVSVAKQFVKFYDRPESPRAAQDFMGGVAPQRSDDGTVTPRAFSPQSGVMTDPEATRGGPRLATDRITTDGSQQFVPGDRQPGTGVAPTRGGGTTVEGEPVSEKLEAPGAARAKEVSQRLSAPVRGQTSTQPAASTGDVPGASQTPSQPETKEAPGAARAKQVSKGETVSPSDTQQGKTPETKGESEAETGETPSLKRKYLGQDIQSIDELNRVINDFVKREDPNGTFKAVRVPLGDLMGKLPGVGLIEQVAKLFGKRVVFFRVTEGADFFDGTILESDDAIFVNVVSDRAHLRILGHELVHDIRKTAPKVYQQLVKALQPLLNERGFAKYTELQKSEGVQTADKILEEAIGDIVGDRFGETEFWRMMADNNPSTFKDVARAVMSFIDRLLGKIGNQTLGSETLVKDLRAARSEIAKILAQSTSGEGASQGSGPAFARKRDNVARDNTAAYVTQKELKKSRSILPDHPEAAEHLRMREMHLAKGTGDYKNERRVLEKDGFRFVIGRVTTQDWIDRVLSAMTPQEVSVFRHWYRDTVGEFKARFGDRWQEYMIAYLLGNKAESPRGALNNALFVAETAGAGGESERLGGLSDEQMKQIYSGKPVSLTGIGAKLYDFVDSALGKTTRSWMGNAIEGASPFVVDRHTFRDSGRVDPLLRDWLARKLGADAVRGIVLDTPVTGSVSSAQYEQITDWGNALADDLNARGFAGGNLMPLEVQAIGWMAMTRLTETNAGGTTEGAMEGMTKTVAAELDFGEGTPFSKKFAAYYDLSKEAQKRVTHEALREVMAVAGELTGVRLVDVKPGIGGWADVVSPNVVARFMSSDQTAEALVATVAYLGQQTSVLALHPANAATGDRVVFDITGSDMSDSFVESTLWKAVSKELEPVFGRNIGFMPSVRPDGSPSIRIAVPLPFGTKKNGEPKTVKDFNVGERLELERGLVDQIRPALTRALATLPSGTYRFDFMRVKGVESINNWTKKGEQNGESHRRRVGERFGPEVQGRLDSVGVPRVERAIIAAIRRENPAASFSRKRKTPAATDSRGVPQSGGVRGGNVPLAVDGRQDQRIGEPLEGGPQQVDVPGVGLVRVGKFQPAVEAAQAYMARAGLQYNPPKTFARVDPVRARRIADEYDRTPHAPGNPEVRAAYDAMIAETVAQYRAILDTGLQIEFIDYAKTGDPYAASPRLAIQDAVENNHLWVFSTADGFGSNEAFSPDQNPLLRDTGFSISGKPALANDLFRVVHDYFGHIKNGVGFRADGEENAWRAHSAMYTPLARRAMTSETRGQNSWVNFGPNAEANRRASAADTKYADQKTVLLPEWVATDGAGDPSFSRKRTPVGFYSALSAGISEIKTSSAPASGWKDAIKGLVNKGQVKQDEVEWSGVNDWLDLQPPGANPFGPTMPKVSKEAVLEYLDGGGVKVEEVVLGAGRMPRLPEGWSLTPTDDYNGFGDAGFVVRDQDGDEMGSGATEREAMREAADPDELRTVDTRYGRYQLPGGENYREVLLTLPQSPEAARLEQEREALNATSSRDPRYVELTNRIKTAQYKSAHWDQPNVIAHIRVNDRTDADGKRVLFVEEIQSDWGQEGKKKGFAPRNAEAQLKAGEERMARRGEEIRRISDRMAALTDEQLDEFNRLADERQRLQDEQGAEIDLGNSIYDARASGVLIAPFVTARQYVVYKDGKELVTKNKDGKDVRHRYDRAETAQAAADKFDGEVRDMGLQASTEGWLNLALKKIMVMAAEGGYDRVAFINGEQSADRYNLRKQVESIEYFKNPDGTYEVTVKPLAGRDMTRDELTESDIEEFVGKEIAQRIVNGDGEKRSSGVAKLTGVDLEVGGEGMKAFYDQIVPAAVKKLLPKVGGGQMKGVEIAADRSGGRYVRYEVGPGAIVDRAVLGVTADGERVVVQQNGDIEAKVKELNEQLSGVKQPGFDVTDAMRQKAEEGLPMFSRKRDPHKDAEQKKLNEGPSWFQDLPPEAQEALRKVGAVPAKLSFRDRVDALKENLASRFIQGVADPFAPIAKLDDTAYMQARMSTNVTGAFGHIVTDGEVKWEGDWLAPVKGTKGMLDILKQLPEGEIDRFMWWIAANRAEKLTREEREFLFSGRDIAALKRLNMPNMGTKMPTRPVVYAKVLGQLNKLNKSVLDVAKQSGLINQEQYNRFAADAFYVPFYRVMEDGDVGGPATAAGLVGQQFSKRLKGGREQLNDLLANYMNNWEHIVHASAKNMAGRSTLDAAVDAGIATEVKGDPPKGSVKVMVDGKAKHYMVSDPLVLDAISSIYTPALQGMAVKIGSMFKRLFTRAVTVSPTFKFYNNLIRDAITSQAISPELSNNPIANTYRGVKLMSKDNPLYNSMLVGGGLFKYSTWDEGDRHEYVKRLIDQGVDQQTILNTPDKVTAFMSGAFRRYMEFGDKVENAQRAAIYDAAIKAGKSQLEASFAARQVIDFSLTGRWAAIRTLAAVVPFFNARVQGMYSLGKLGIAPTVRAAKQGKDASASDRQRAARFAAVSAAVTAATIALYLYNYDDEDFKRREDWDRDSFWWIKIGDVAWRIPKPFEIGAFATIIERGLEQIVDESVEGKVFGKRLYSVVMDQLSMNPVPQLIRPMLDVYANKDGFRETDIESPGMRRLPIEDRVGQNTSYAARALGAVSKEFADILETVIGKESADKVQFSPVQIDYLIKGYLGWVGTQALMLSDEAIRGVSGIESPTPRFQEQIPVRLTLGNTLQELPTRGSRYVGDFYRQSREINEVMAAIREYEQARDFDKARELREKEGDKVELAKLYSRTQRRMSEINKELRRIRDDTEMSADEKRARIDQLEEIREEYARTAEENRKSRR